MVRLPYLAAGISYAPILCSVCMPSSARPPRLRTKCSHPTEMGCDKGKPDVRRGSHPRVLVRWRWDASERSQNAQGGGVARTARNIAQLLVAPERSFWCQSQRSQDRPTTTTCPILAATHDVRSPVTRSAASLSHSGGVPIPLKTDTLIRVQGPSLPIGY